MTGPSVGDTTALAVTVHDPDGRMSPGVERAGPLLAARFAGIVVNATTTTSAGLLDRCRTAMRATVTTHPPDGTIIGRARRDAVETALLLRPPVAHVVYSDLDHALRWVEARPDEVDALLGLSTPHHRDHAADLVVVGRSPRAFAESPRRLQETERLVNHVYGLLHPGRDWDLMFATRWMSRSVAEAIVEGCDEATIANDVVWPLFAEKAGFTVGWFAADGLSYRTTPDFDGDDDHDDSASHWIRRIEIAAGHAAAVRPYL